MTARRTRRRRRGGWSTLLSAFVGVIVATGPATSVSHSDDARQGEPEAPRLFRLFDLDDSMHGAYGVGFHLDSERVVVPRHVLIQIGRPWLQYAIDLFVEPSTVELDLPASDAVVFRVDRAPYSRRLVVAPPPAASFTDVTLCTLRGGNVEMRDARLANQSGVSVGGSVHGVRLLCRASRGESGSPLLDREGRLAGWLSAGSSVGRAVAAPALERLFDAGERIDFSTWRARATAPGGVAAIRAYARSLELYLAEEWHGAAAAFDVAIRAGLPHTHSCWAAVYRGYALFRASDPRGFEVLQSASAACPSDPAPSRILGELLRESGRLQEAELAYRTALARAPSDADGVVGLATVRILQRRYDEAEALVERAMRLEGRSPATLLWLGYLELNRDRPGAARVPLEELLQVAPESPEGLRYLGEVGLRLQDRALFDATLRRLCQIDSRGCDELKKRWPLEAGPLPTESERK